MKAVTPETFKAMRNQIGYSQPRIARLFGVSPLSVIHWEKGHHSIPGSARILMFLLWDEQVNGNKRAVRDYMNLYVRDLEPTT